MLLNDPVEYDLWNNESGNDGGFPKKTNDLLAGWREAHRELSLGHCLC